MGCCGIVDLARLHLMDPWQLFGKLTLVALVHTHFDQLADSSKSSRLQPYYTKFLESVFFPQHWL